MALAGGLFVSLAELVTVNDPAKQSAKSSMALAGGLPTMELPGEWEDKPGGDLAVALGGDMYTPGLRFSSNSGGFTLLFEIFKEVPSDIFCCGIDLWDIMVLMVISCRSESSDY